MNKKSIQIEYSEKISLINKFNKFYYDDNDTKVTDQKYDKLKKEILELEKKYKFLKSNKSPSKVVGFKPSKNFQKIVHRSPMLSLSNAFGREDLINFETRILNFLSKNDDFQLSYSAEPKIDGISASLIYKKGEFKVGLSRGDGKEGEDISANLTTKKIFQKKLSPKIFLKKLI